MSNPPQIALETEHQRATVQKLNEFGFIAEMQAEKFSEGHGVLISGDLEFPVTYRVRDCTGGISRCSFVDLPDETQRQLRAHLAGRFVAPARRPEPETEPEPAADADQDVSGGEPATPQRSMSSAHRRQQRAAEQRQPAASGGKRRTWALPIGILAVAGVAGLAWKFYPQLVRADSSQDVSVAADPSDGMATPQPDQPGDDTANEMTTVRDPLVKPAQARRDPEAEILETKLQRNRSRLLALRAELDSFEAALEIKSRQLQLEQKLADSQRAAARQRVAAAENSLDELRPFVASGAITQLELSEVQAQLDQAKLELEQAATKLEQVALAQQAVDQKILVTNGAVDAGYARITSQIKLLEVEREELRSQLERHSSPATNASHQPSVVGM